MTSPSLPPLIWEPGVLSISRPPSIFARALGRGIRGGEDDGEGTKPGGQGIYQKFGDKLTVYPQFSQFVAQDDPRIHRVVHLTYRVGKKDLSYPRPFVDLTTRKVTTPAAESFPTPRRPR